MNTKTILFFFFLLGLGCTSNDKRIHPDPNKFPSNVEVDHSVDVSKLNEEKFQGFLAHGALKKIGTIGSESVFESHTYFDRIPKKVEMDNKGNIYLVQRHTNSIVVYNTEGVYKGEIGRGGRGPGEFVEIVSFVFSQDFKRLYVLDVHEIEIFERTKNGYEHRSTFLHDLMLRTESDMCILGKDLFVTGTKLKEGNTSQHQKNNKRIGSAEVQPPIAKFSLPSFEYQGSFGFMYESYFEWGRYSSILSQTMLKCDEQTETILGVSKHFPFLIGYDSDGNQKWVSKIKGYVSTQFEEFNTSEGPAFYQYVNEDVFNYKFPLQTVDIGENSLLQFIFRSPDEFYAPSQSPPLEKGNFRSILINNKSGELMHSDAYEFIALANDSLVITAEQNLENFRVEFTIYKYE